LPTFHGAVLSLFILCAVLIFFLSGRHLMRLRCHIRVLLTEVRSGFDVGVERPALDLHSGILWSRTMWNIRLWLRIYFRLPSVPVPSLGQLRSSLYPTCRAALQQPVVRVSVAAGPSRVCCSRPPLVCSFCLFSSLVRCCPVSLRP